MEELKNQLVEIMEGFIADSKKSEDNKAAAKRMRVATLKIARLGKEFRHLSLQK